MAAICGLFSRRGVPLEVDHLERITDSTRSWANGEVQVWRENDIALVSLRDSTGPRARIRSGGLAAVDGEDLVVVAVARLYNRSEIVRQLGFEEADSAGLSSAELIRFLFQRHGKRCIDFLSGDWVFAAWSKRARELFVACDHCGNNSIYYFLSPQLFAFSSSFPALLELPQVSRALNSTRIFQILTGWPGDGSDTTLRDVKCLPQAHSMMISSRTARTWRYWDLGRLPELKLRSDDAYVEAFLDVFKTATEARIRDSGQVGILLSGGLDSGAVAAAARPALPASEVLRAYTWVPLAGSPHMAGARIANEASLASDTARHVGGIEHLLVSTDVPHPVEALELSLGIHHQPQVGAGNEFLVHSLLNAAARNGVETLLMGQMGDGSVSFRGSRESLTRELVWSGQWARALKEEDLLHKGLVMQARLLVRNLAPEMALRLVRWAKSTGNGRGGFELPMFIAPALINGLPPTEERRFTRWARTTVANRGTRRGQRMLLRPNLGQLAFSLRALGAHYGLDILDPTADHRVVEFCLSIPGSQYFGDGQQRWLIRRAMRDLLPESVRLLTEKCLQGVDVEDRIRSPRVNWLGMLDGLDKSPTVSAHLHLAELRRVASAIEQRHALEDIGIVAQFLRALQVATYLRQLERRKGDGNGAKQGSGQERDDRKARVDKAEHRGAQDYRNGRGCWH